MSRIERATHGHGRCSHCGGTIDHGTARVHDPVQRSTIYHLDCAIEARHELVRKALLGHEPVDATLVPDRGAVLARVRARAAALAAERRAAADPDRRPDPVLDPLLAQLEAEPDDRGVLAVVGDVLAVRGDPRGELITAELTAEVRPAAVLPGRRRDELRALLAPSFGDVPASFTWAGGFLDHLAIEPQTAPRTARLAPVWRHPSLRLLRSLSIAGAAGPLMYAWFPALRRFELVSSAGAPGPIGDVIAAMPRLEVLVIGGPTEQLDLAHATLGELQLGRDNDHVLHVLEPALLPQLRKLTTACASIETIDVMLDRGWAGQLDELALTGAGLDGGFPDRLAAALGARRLARLDLRGSRLACSRRALRSLCNHLEVVVEPAPGMTVRHRDKPEWGVGRVVAVEPGRVTIEFADAGKKTLRDTLPALVFDDD